MNVTSTQPVSAEVRRLKDAFPVETLNPGRRISHEEISRIVSEPVGVGRYYPIVTKWRRWLEEEHQVYLETVHAQGYDVLSEQGKVDRLRKKLKRQDVATTRLLNDAYRIKPEKLGREDRDFLLQAQNRLALRVGIASLKGKVELPFIGVE